MKMLEFYKKAISLGDLIADPQGMLSHQIPGTNRDNALTITSKRVVLPTKENLDNPDWSNRMAFHPLVENQIGSESLIHERFRWAVNRAVNLRFSYILVAIARICKEEFVEKRNTLGAEYAGIWNATSKADDKFYQNVVKIIDEHPTFIHTVIHRGMKVGDKQWRVGCEVFFPVLEELIATKDREIQKVKLRVSDVETLKNLYELIFPNSSVKNFYTGGDDSTYSPSLFAQLRATDKLYAQLNNFFKTLNEITEDADFIRDTSWIQTILSDSKELNEEAQLIGLLEGNSSKPKKTSKAAGGMIDVHQTSTPVVRQTPQQPAPMGAPVQHAPAVQPQPQTINNSPAYGAPVKPSHPVIGGLPNQSIQAFAHQPKIVQAPQQPTPQSPMTHQKIGMDPTQLNSNTRVSSGTGFVSPRNIPVEHVSNQQNNVMVMQTPQGPVAVQSMTMAEAAQMAQQQAIQQQQQQQMMMAVQQKAAIAQSLGYRVFQNNTGSYSVEISDGKGGSVYQPIEQWEAPVSPAGQPVVAGMPVIPPHGQQNMMGMPGMVQPQMQQVQQPLQPGGTVSINDWIRSNPVATANMQTQQMQQQMMLMQMYGIGQPNNQMMNAGNQAYVPSHMRAAAMMPVGMIRTVGS